MFFLFLFLSGRLINSSVDCLRYRIRDIAAVTTTATALTESFASVIYAFAVMAISLPERVLLDIITGTVFSTLSLSSSCPFYLASAPSTSASASASANPGPSAPFTSALVSRQPRVTSVGFKYAGGLKSERPLYIIGGGLGVRGR